MRRTSSDHHGEVNGVLMPPGPLAAWRFSLAIGASFIITGMPLLRATASRDQLDLALMRSLAAAALVWVVLGGINRILASAEADRMAAARLDAQVRAILAASAAQSSAESLTDDAASSAPAGSESAHSPPS
ncbi:MAG: hypothetical protein AB7Q42_16165 [Acidimicrobiia bacterium]